jgi:hypothetical protein
MKEMVKRRKKKKKESRILKPSVSEARKSAKLTRKELGRKGSQLPGWGQKISVHHRQQQAELYKLPPPDRGPGDLKRLSLLTMLMEPYVPQHEILAAQIFLL